MNIVILDANTLTLHNDIDFSAFDQYGNVNDISVKHWGRSDRGTD